MAAPFCAAPRCARGFGRTWMGAATRIPNTLPRRTLARPRRHMPTSVTVLLFAGIREHYRRSTVEVVVPDEAVSAAALLQLVAAALGESPATGLPATLAACLVAVDCAVLAPDDAVLLRAGCEVALIPPVSGG